MSVKEFRLRLLAIAIALDCLLLAFITLGECKRGETISAACWSLEQDGKTLGRIFRPLIDLLFRPLEANHCSESWLVEQYMYAPRAKA